MWHVYPHPFPMGGGEGVGGMDPAVGVEHILGDVLCVNTVNGVANILEKEGVNYV